MNSLQIDPWVDPAPSNANTMTLNKLRQFIKKKQPWAYRCLAKRYEIGGPGLKRSKKKTCENLEKGMKLGDPICMNEIGNYYVYHGEVDIHNGRQNYNNRYNLPQFATKAFKHYQMGALKGFDVAQYNLGECYSNGVGVERSSSKAREWYNRAAAQYNEEAIENLRLLEIRHKRRTKATKEWLETKATKEEPNKTKPKESEPPTSTNFDNSQEIEIKDTTDLEIVPWIDDAPKNVNRMTLKRLRHKVKNHINKVWAINEL